MPALARKMILKRFPALNGTNGNGFHLHFKWFPMTMTLLVKKQLLFLTHSYQWKNDIQLTKRQVEAKSEIFTVKPLKFISHINFICSRPRRRQ